MRIVISRTIEVLGEECFSTARIGSLAIEDCCNMRTIGRNCFSFVEHLKVLFIPGSISVLPARICEPISSIEQVLFGRLSGGGEPAESTLGISCSESEAFLSCSSLKSICIPASVEVLGENCLANCRSLSRLTLESTSKLQRIEAAAFSSCSQLKSICIPASTISIDGSAFVNVPLTVLQLEEGNCHFRVSDHFLLDSAGVFLVRYFGKDKDVIVGSDIVLLCQASFCFCQSLCSLRFEPASKLRIIGVCAFLWCMSLRSICIPASIEILCENCFGHCAALSTIIFEPISKLQRVERRAFHCCMSLNSICIPASTIFIPGSAFQVVPLALLQLEEGNCHFRIHDHFLLDFAGVSVIRFFGTDKDVIIGSDIEILDEESFSVCLSVCSLTFEPVSKVQRIGSLAFFYCLSLISIFIPASVKILCFSCFRACTSLSDVCFESDSNLQQIESFAFSDCSSLTSVCIPASVEILCTSCFIGCESLSLVTFEPGSRLRYIVEIPSADVPTTRLLSVSVSGLLPSEISLQL
jgi:hypothetical protein